MFGIKKKRESLFLLKILLIKKTFLYVNVKIKKKKNRKEGGGVWEHGKEAE